MKKITTIAIVALVTIFSYLHSSQQRTIIQELERLDSINHANAIFPNGDSLTYLTDYFDSHGNSNQQMKAHYLRGLAYAQQGQTPLAVEFFINAIQAADTTKTNCDYRQLSKAYGQLAEINYNQNLITDMLSYNNKALHYAKQCNDTLFTILYQIQRTKAYERINNPDSLISLVEKIYNFSYNSKYRTYGAGALGIIIVELSNKKQFAKASKYINVYEKESGFFNSDNNIEEGREIYYYNKGTFFLLQNKLDSAEFYFRKELNTGKDFNNQNAASKGLAEVFKTKHIADSALKYSLRAYYYNDSSYAKMTTEEIIKKRAMFDYSRSLKIALRKEKEAKIHATIWHLLLFIMLCLSIYAWYYIKTVKEKKQKERKAYEQSLTILKKTHNEIDALKKHENEYQQLIIEKERLIEEQLQLIKKYKRKEYRGTKSSEKILNQSEEYHKLLVLAQIGKQLTNEELLIIDNLISLHFPEFMDFLFSKAHLLNANELKLLKLTRLHIKPVPISHMLGVSPSYVTKMRKIVAQKLFENIPGSFNLDKELSKIG
jgi:hypothetical protein